MTKRRRSEELPNELPEGQEWGGLVNDSIGVAAVVQGHPGSVPGPSGTTGEGCEVHRLAKVKPVEGAVEGTPDPPEIHGEVTNQEPTLPAEVDAVTRPELHQ